MPALGKGGRRSATKRPIRLAERKLARERAHRQSRAADRLIEIDLRQPSASYLDTLVHEALHVLYPGLKESAVARGAREIARLVWLRAFTVGMRMGKASAPKPTAFLLAH